MLNIKGEGGLFEIYSVSNVKSNKNVSKFILISLELSIKDIVSS